MGEIGAKEIYRSLACNEGLRYVGLEDNRISMQSLGQIEAMMKNVARGTAQVNVTRQASLTQPAGWMTMNDIPPQTTFPIS